MEYSPSSRRTMQLCLWRLNINLQNLRGSEQIEESSCVCLWCKRPKQLHHKETFRVPFYHACSFCTQWMFRFSFCFSAAPRTGCGWGPAPDSWSPRRPTPRCCWTVSLPPPPSARTGRLRRLAPRQPDLVTMTAALREPGRTVSAPSPWSSAPAGEGGASLSPPVRRHRCQPAAALRICSRCVGRTARFPWRPTCRQIRQS